MPLKAYNPVILALSSTSLLGACVLIGLTTRNHGLYSLWVDIVLAVMTIIYNVALLTRTFRSQWRFFGCSGAPSIAIIAFTFSLVAIWVVEFGISVETAALGPQNKKAHRKATWSFAVQVGESVLTSLEAVILATIGLYLCVEKQKIDLLDLEAEKSKVFYPDPATV
ncbi:hypothetical protein HGRIS_005249 [Hohenbuehelia grisea]|uniref:MARVEL domain-containing protein n=1 Tax=Hohenbuehelia grisea TaxID=104357 RepID=A0ABR3JFA7_9AGAR